MGAQFEELGATLEGLDGLDAEQQVFRSTGALLVQVKDPKVLREELASRKEEVEVRFESLQRREKKLKSTLENLEQEFRGGLQKLGG